MNGSIWRWRAGLAAWMSLIFLLSSSLFAEHLSFERTVDFLGFLNYVARKCAHAGEYAVLAFLWFRSIWTRRDRFKACAAWSVALTVAYAATDEWHQSYIPERSGKASDVLFDAAGALAASWALWWLRARDGNRWRRRILGPLVERAEV